VEHQNKGPGSRFETTGPPSPTSTNDPTRRMQLSRSQLVPKPKAFRNRGWRGSLRPCTVFLQNVNSYRDLSSLPPPSDQPISSRPSTTFPGPSTTSPFKPVSPSTSGQTTEQQSPSRSSSPGLSPGFKTIYKARTGGLSFAYLLDTLSAAFPEMRFRFTSPHPKDFPDELIGLLRDRPNVCKSIHLPAQSGSSRLGSSTVSFPSWRI
jgi:hypothetical protein